MSVAPRAVLLISLCGGCPVNPVKYIFSIKKASDVLKQEPTLFKLLRLSKTIQTGNFLMDLN